MACRLSVILPILLVIGPVLVGQDRENPDPNYVALRKMKFDHTQSTVVENWTWKLDVATFRLIRGRLFLFPPVLGRVTGAVFVGDGEFTLEPIVAVEQRYLKHAYGSEHVSEPIDSVVFRFTDGTLAEWQKTLKFESGQTSPEAATAFLRHQEETRMKLRQNVEAQTLKDLLDAGSSGTFSAFIKAKKYQRTSALPK